MDADRFDRLARTYGRRSRRALGFVPILGLSRKLGLRPNLVEDAAAGDDRSRHTGRDICNGLHCPQGTFLTPTCTCQCLGTGLQYHPECKRCLPVGECCKGKQPCGSNCIPKGDCCDNTHRTCQKKVKKKGKKHGKKTVNFCVARPTCCPDETACPIAHDGCCKQLLEACTTFDGCCDISQDKFTCDGKWCCQPGQKCCPGEGCVAEGSCCIADGACGDLLCCPPNTTCTVGSYNGQKRAHCCPPMPGQLGPCDGECCATNPALSMCCPGLSNPCRAIAAGC